MKSQTILTTILLLFLVVIVLTWVDFSRGKPVNTVETAAEDSIFISDTAEATSDTAIEEPVNTKIVYVTVPVPYYLENWNADYETINLNKYSGTISELYKEHKNQWINLIVTTVDDYADLLDSTIILQAYTYGMFEYVGSDYNKRDSRTYLDNMYFKYCFPSDECCEEIRTVGLSNFEPNTTYIISGRITEKTKDDKLVISDYAVCTVDYLINNGMPDKYVNVLKEKMRANGPVLGWSYGGLMF